MNWVNCILDKLLNTCFESYFSIDPIKIIILSQSIISCIHFQWYNVQVHWWHCFYHTVHMYVCIPMFQVNWKHVSIRYTVGNNHCDKGGSTQVDAPRLIQCPVYVNMPTSCTSGTFSYALHIHYIFLINMILCYTATLRNNLLINSNYRYCRS